MEIKRFNGMSPYTVQVNQPQPREKEREKAAEPHSSADKVAFSPQAKMMQDIHQAASKAPDIREDKVHSIKEQLAAGRYQIDSTSIAQKLLQSDDFFG